MDIDLSKFDQAEQEQEQAEGYDSNLYDEIDASKFEDVS